MEAGDRPRVEALLAQGAEVNAVDAKGLTPLHLAVAAGDKAMVVLLLASGADIGQKDKAGDSALQLAWLHGHGEIVQLLSSRGVAEQSAEPASRAAGNDMDEKERLFLEQIRAHLASGDDVNARGQPRDRPHRRLLHLAAGFGYVHAARFLIEHGADVNARDEIGRTPLHWAAWNGHKAVVDLLLENKAEANAVSNDRTQETPLDMATRNAQAVTAALLRSHGGKTFSELRK